MAIGLTTRLIVIILVVYPDSPKNVNFDPRESSRGSKFTFWASRSIIAQKNLSANLLVFPILLLDSVRLQCCWIDELTKADEKMIKRTNRSKKFLKLCPLACVCGAFDKPQNKEWKESFEKLNLSL